MESGSHSFIRDAVVREVKEEDLHDLVKLISKYKDVTEMSGEPLHLRLPPNETLSSFNLEEFLDERIETPYHQYVTKVKKGVYDFRRGPPAPTERKAKSAKKDDFVTVRQLMTSGQKPKTLQGASIDKIEKVYWETVDRIANSPNVQKLATYASDVEGSLMDFESKKITLCNLNTMLQRIVSKYGEPAPGISTTMLYIGVWLSTFTPHLEDKDLWSASYLHYGASKIWYLVPSLYTDKFESKINGHLKYFIKKQFHRCKSLFRHKSTLVDPSWYKQNGIPLIRIVQNPGDLIVIPPYCYHFGFNESFNISETVNFATESWLPTGLLARECMHVKECLLDMEPFVIECLPNRFAEYVEGTLELCHPFDSKKKKVKVAPPVLKVLDDLKDYKVKSKGLDYIHAAKMHQGQQYLFVVVGEIKGWVQRSDIEGMFWASTGKKVELPSSFQNMTMVVDPFFHYRPII